MTVTGGGFARVGQRPARQASAQLVVPTIDPMTYCCDKLQCSLPAPYNSLMLTRQKAVRQSITLPRFQLQKKFGTWPNVNI